MAPYGRVRNLKKILFVCSGNTCRSPLAEGIASKVFSEDRPFKSNMTSAGSSAQDGLPASQWAIKVANANTLDLSKHKATLLSRTLVKEADLIVAMASNHRSTVGIIEPSALEYTCLLTDFCDDEEGDVPDPIGMGIEKYEETYVLIDKCIRAMKERMDAFGGWKKQ
jgi:protein-tyrosine-phosphatase